MQTYSLCGVAFSGDYLAHYGIKGQVHGRRRFQNPDGSLTLAGRARYGYTDTNTGDSLRDNQYRAHMQRHADAKNQESRLGGISSGLTSRWMRITNNANAIRRAGDSASRGITNAGRNIHGGIRNVEGAIGKATRGTAFEGAGKAVNRALGNIGKAAEGASKRIADRAKDVSSWASKTYEKLANGFHDTVDRVKMRAGEAMKKASNFVSGIWNKVTEAAKSGFEKAKSVATTAVSKLKQFGGAAINMGKSLINRVSTMLSNKPQNSVGPDAADSRSYDTRSASERRASVNRQKKKSQIEAKYGTPAQIKKNKAQADFESRNARENKASKEFGDEMARYYSTPSVQAEHEARKKKGYAR